MKAQHFKLVYPQIVNVLGTYVEIAPAVVNAGASTQKGKYKAIFDTGAQGTVITKKVAVDLGLSQISVRQVFHAQGDAMAAVYLVNLNFNGQPMVFPGLNVTEGVLRGFDVLIGMDVLSCGDFSITNHNGKTELNFQCPSCGIDALHHAATGKVVQLPPPAHSTKVPRNDPCPCNSGKKYKYCCGR